MLKRISDFMHSHTHLMLVGLVVLGLLLRINIFDMSASSIFDVDVARDYLLAGHMVHYGDMPIVGPDGYLGPQSNSPFYFYIVAALLWVHDSILFPGLINVFIQAASIIVVYFIGRELFGARTGMAAAFLFTVFDATVAQAVLIWQPYLMSFVLLLSWAFLIDSRHQARSSSMYASCILFAFAVVLHGSVLVDIPIFAFAVVWSLRSRATKLSEYIKISIPPFLILFIAYLPVLYNALFIAPHRSPLTAVQKIYLPPPLPDPSVLTLMGNILERSAHFISYFFAGSFYNGIYLYGWFFLILFSCGLYVYLTQQTRKEKRIYVIILVVLVILSFLSVGVLKLYVESDFPVRYYTPSFVPLLLLCAEIVGFFAACSGRKLRTSIMVCAGIIIIGASWGSIQNLGALPNRLQTLALYGLPYSFVNDSGAQVLISTISTLSHGKGHVVPFDIRTFEHGAEELTKSELLWVSLERAFDQQLVRADSAAYRGYSPVHDPQFMFIRCLNVTTPCDQLFNKKYESNYHIDGILFDSPQEQYLYAHRI